ncbi:hypothetical protein QCA50_009747 [Cerrena zonata]|uniref:DUF6830 domain-containing protein n=1 Tax=Cerrena zonata TaxID=2478898 RepID=A0AAW0G6W8_9APHY
MGLIVDLRLPNGHSTTRLLLAVRGMLDFLYLAQYKAHSSTTLDDMDAALRKFHANKNIFVDLGIRVSFQLPKLHNAGHYRYSIELFSTTDNYNTQTTERLHIDYAKDAYNASNTRNAFAQMTKWLERKEKVFRHDHFVKWRLRLKPRASSLTVGRAPVIRHPHVVMTKYPTVYSVDFNSLADNYGAVDIHNTITMFIAHRRNPTFSGNRLERAAANIILPFSSLQIFHKIRFYNRPVEDWLNSDDVMDVAHARPSYQDKQGRLVPARFDTVLINIVDNLDCESVGVSYPRGHGIGSHAAHGLESNRQFDPNAPTSSGNPEQIEKFPAGLESNASDSKKHGHVHAHELSVVELAAAQIVSIAILEFGVILHSILIGLTLAVDEDFKILFVVLVFHQTFKGLGVSSRLTYMDLPAKYSYVPIIGALLYGITTPLGIAVGLGIRTTYNPGSTTASIVSGILDAFSSGILIYTGLVELLTHEFLFNKEMIDGSNTKLAHAIGCLILGCGFMAVLGHWA